MNASAQTRKVTVLDVLGNGGIFSQHLPGYEKRDQQIETATLIQTGIRERRHVIVELGTGGGKSHAGLVPAVLSGERVVYSTAVKSLQEQIANKDAPFVARVLEPVLGRPIRYSVLKGRGNYVCLRNVAQLEERGEFRSIQAADAFHGLSEWIGQQRDERGVADIETYEEALPADLRMDVVTSSEECAGQRCRFFEECFAERAKGNAKNADIVIVNHKLLCVDAMIREKTGAQATMIPDYSLLIADEAHDWEDIIRDTAGFEITTNRLKRLAWLVQKLTIEHPFIVEAGADTDEVRKANAWADEQDAILRRIDLFLDILKARLERDEDVREMRLGDERSVKIGDEPLPGMDDPRPTISQVAAELARFALLMAGGTPTWLDGEDRDLWSKTADQTEQIANELLTVLAPEQDATWVRRAALDGENGKTRVVLDAKPIDVAPIGRRWFFGGVSKQRATKKNADDYEDYVDALPPLVVISMSATISANGSMRMFRERLGVGQALELVSGSPFDYQNHALLYLPDRPDDLVPVQRNKPGYESYIDNLAAEMRGLTLDAKGGAFLLFTSRSAMNEVYARIADDLRAAGLLVMKQGDASRNKIMEMFRADGSAVLFGLKTYGVGVDVQGSALRLVAIDKVPFNPPTDVVWKALCDHVKRNGGNDFRDLSMPNAIITLKQFAGRLIRSKTDMGVMALLDGRVRLKPYGREIIGNMPPARITSDVRMVKALYERMAMGYDSTPRLAAPAVVVAATATVPQPRRFRRLADERPAGQRFRRLGR
jgi:ATP-dependent DNA helicase DinG